MNILFVWDGDYPWDIRVEKVCNSLIREGHEIHLVCRNLKRQARFEKYKGINLHRIKCLPKFFGRLNMIFTFPLFISPLWLLEMYKQAKQNNCKLIISRDLPMAPASLFVGKSLGIPVVLDMAECYPEMLRCVWKFERKKLVNIFIRNPIIADILEKYVVHRVKQIIVMIEESRDRLIRMNVDQTKIVIVSNTPEMSKYKACDKKIINTVDNIEKIKVVYVGLLNASRGMDTILMSIKKYVDSGKSIEMTVAGSGKDEMRLKAMVNKYKIDHCVTFLGWIDNEKVPQLISNNDICVVPHHKCSHWEATIPNKLFDYMAAGKPVLVTDVTPMKRIVEECKCGLVYKDYNIDDLFEKLKMLECPHTRSEMGENGRKSINAKYRWDVDEKVLNSMVAKYAK